MSGGKACACPEKKKPMDQRVWHVLQWRSNHSAFNGYHHTPSNYSSVQCAACGAVWRTNAPYQDVLKHKATT